MIRYRKQWMFHRQNLHCRTLTIGFILLCILAVADSVKADTCPLCDRRTCPNVSLDNCPGELVWDSCGCCRSCDSGSSFNSNVISPTTTPYLTTADNSSRGCASLSCPRFKVCTLNIQDIPMCRCPTKFWCKNIERKEVCAVNKTFKNRCLLRIEECAVGKRIRVKPGPCEKSREKPHEKSVKKVGERKRQRKEKKEQERKQKRKHERKHKRQKNDKNKKLRDKIRERIKGRYRQKMKEKLRQRIKRRYGGVYNTRF